MIPADVLNEASRLALAAGVKILQGFRLADTDAAHVARLLDYMQPEAGETWVDIGCGFGEVARLMHAACPDLNFILVNNNYFQLSHAPRDFLQLHADMHDLPLEDESADGCMLLYALCHAEPFEMALREAARVTRRGGRLLVFDYERLPDQTRPTHPGGAAHVPDYGLADPNRLMRERLFARAVPFDEMVAIADIAGWTVDWHENPDGCDDVFRMLYGNDEEYARIFDDLRPVIWTAVRR